MSALYLIGISHECANAVQVGSCSVPANLCLTAQEQLLKISTIEEAIVLSTCNRVEFYFVCSGEAPVKEIIDSLTSALGENRNFELISKIGYLKKNQEAISHLYEVASGLRSQMTGETEIFGQVKATYARASAAGHCSSILNALFQKASQCAKWIRTNTDIGYGKISIGSVSSELAARIFENLDCAKILLLGSGEVGRLVADALYVRGARAITVASRTRANADKLAMEIGCVSDDMPSAIANVGAFDIVICASFAPYPLLNKSDIQMALASRAGKAMFLIDLAIPHNITPDCGDLDDAFLYNLEDLSKIANENIATRKAEIDKARVVISEKSEYLARRLFA